MSKYSALWQYLKNSGKPQLTLTFAEVEKIAGTPLDHSFLRYKKELTAYGYEVQKISMKAQTVAFGRKENFNENIKDHSDTFEARKNSE